MINIMLNHGVMPGLIWSDKIDLAMRSRFPRAEQQNTQWVISFEGFLEELDLNSFLTQEYTPQAFHRMSSAKLTISQEIKCHLRVRNSDRGQSLQYGRGVCYPRHCLQGSEHYNSRVRYRAGKIY